MNNLIGIRKELERRGLEGFVVPHADEYQNEYLPACAERLAWLTGFTGSAGTAVVLREKAALFTDGRYTLQAAKQVDGTAFEILHSVEHPVSDWLPGVLKEGDKLGYDPWLHTPDGAGRLREACEKAGATLVAVAGNPIDALWTDRPDPPLAPITLHPLSLAGKESAEKCREVTMDKAEAVALTAPDSIAWLLNIRGGDVPYAPLPLGYVILHGDGTVDLFMDGRKLGPPLGDHVTTAEPSAFGPALDKLKGRRVMLDYATAPMWVLNRLKSAGAVVVKGTDPCQLPKACKNPVELDGMRAAHRRDGLALTRFLAWLDGQKGLTEMEAADKLEAFRREGDRFHSLSFPTIAAAGAHGAIVHYAVDRESNAPLQEGSLFLVDSGAQYEDGTTDVTRTVAIGTPTPEMKRRFTQVLKGHIALASARFPVGTMGGQLDTLARTALWADGVDYDHGTGHGVGHFLSVHEGPQRVAKRGGDVELKPGMVLSIEPGYYKEGAFGIRIENLAVVVALAKPPGAEKDLLGFEILTLAPIDERLVEDTLLTAEERAWLEAYQQRVRDNG